MSEAVVIISRRWKKGAMIRVEVKTWPEGDQGIEVSMSLEEFLDVITEEVGSPALLMTQNGLRQALARAADKALTGMKAETARVM